MNWTAFSAESIIFTALGAVLLWGKLAQLGRRNDIAIWGLGYMWKLAGFRPRSKLYRLLEFGAFVAIGVLVGIALVDPRTPAQALTTGLGWTGLLAAPSHR